jgi:hypothetical protein
LRLCMCPRPSCKQGPRCMCIWPFRPARHRSDVFCKRQPRPTVRSYTSARCSPNTAWRFPGRPPTFHPFPRRHQCSSSRPWRSCLRGRWSRLSRLGRLQRQHRASRRRSGLPPHLRQPRLRRPFHRSRHCRLQPEHRARWRQRPGLLPRLRQPRLRRPFRRSRRCRPQREHPAC